MDGEVEKRAESGRKAGEGGKAGEGEGEREKGGGISAAPWALVDYLHTDNSTN